VIGRLLDVRDRLLDLWDHVATMPRRPFVLALLALAAPLPAFAIAQGGGEKAPAALSVSVSLDSCGLIGTEVVCKLDASYGEVEGATSYTAAVTRADGSVVDYGEVGSGGTSLWVPYVGSGTYSVQIAAYGDPARPGGEPKLLSRDYSSAEGRAPGRAHPSGGTVEPGYVEPGAPRDGLESSEGTVGDEQGSESPAPECQETGPPAEVPEPPAEVPGDADGDGAPDEPASSDSGGESAEATSAPLGGLPEATAAELEAEGDLPESVDCPAE
jgi:hypothetical protein